MSDYLATEVNILHFQWDYYGCYWKVHTQTPSVWYVCLCACVCVCHIDGLVQDWCNSLANALELQSLALSHRYCVINAVLCVTPSSPPHVRVSHALKHAELSYASKIVGAFFIYFTPRPAGREPRALMIAIVWKNQSTIVLHNPCTHSNQIILGKHQFYSKTVWRRNLKPALL